MKERLKFVKTLIEYVPIRNKDGVCSNEYRNGFRDGIKLAIKILDMK